jgi:hypothetical protein
MYGPSTAFSCGSVVLSNSCRGCCTSDDFRVVPFAGVSKCSKLRKQRLILLEHLGAIKLHPTERCYSITTLAVDTGCSKPRSPKHEVIPRRWHSALKRGLFWAAQPAD